QDWGWTTCSDKSEANRQAAAEAVRRRGAQLQARSGKRDLDVQPAGRSGPGDQRRAVRIGDRPHDRQAEAVPLAVPDPPAVELLERLEEPVDLRWRGDPPPGSGHDTGAARDRSRPPTRPPPPHVVPPPR